MLFLSDDLMARSNDRMASHSCGCIHFCAVNGRLRNLLGAEVMARHRKQVANPTNPPQVLHHFPEWKHLGSEVIDVIQDVPRESDMDHPTFQQGRDGKQCSHAGDLDRGNRQRVASEVASIFRLAPPGTWATFAVHPKLPSFGLSRDLPSCRDPQIFRGRTRAGEGRTQPGKCEPGEPQRCLQRHSSRPTSPIEGTPVSSSLVKLYEQHARECAEAAERTDDPVQRVILLRMAREWMEDAAAIASTLPEPERTGSRGPSGNRAA